MCDENPRNFKDYLIRSSGPGRPDQSESSESRRKAGEYPYDNPEVVLEGEGGAVRLDDPRKSRKRTKWPRHVTSTPQLKDRTFRR